MGRGRTGRHQRRECGSRCGWQEALRVQFHQGPEAHDGDERVTAEGHLYCADRAYRDRQRDVADDVSGGVEEREVPSDNRHSGRGDKSEQRLGLQECGCGDEAVARARTSGTAVEWAMPSAEPHGGERGARHRGERPEDVSEFTVHPGPYAAPTAVNANDAEATAINRRVLLAYPRAGR